MIHKTAYYLLATWVLLVALPKAGQSVETGKSPDSNGSVKKAAWSPTPQSANRRRSSTRRAPDPTAGDDIRGEDLEVRRAAVDALGKRNGLVVVVNPTNGRILTIVNQKLALSTGFQPCSTFKPAVALAALKEGIITESTEIRVNRRTYMTMTEAIAVSNNPFFATLGKKLGFARVREYAARWGFGQKAGWNIEGEDPGVFPDRPPYGGVGYLCSHGAGIKATALQMAAFVSALANGGDLYYLQYPRTTGEIVNFRPRLKRKLFISQYLPKLKNAMAATVLYGTGASAYDYDHTIYGKTGTCRGWVVDDRLQHLQQPRFPGPLRGRGDVQVRCAVGGIDRVGVRGPQRHRHGLMVGQHDVAANKGADRGEQSGAFQPVRRDVATVALCR